MSTMSNPYAPPRAAVRDITTPDASLVYAERGTRLGAAILDGIILAVMVYVPLVVMMVAGALSSAAPGAEFVESEGVPPLLMAGFGLMIVGFAVWSWLTIKYVRLNGQTIAKKMLKIKVVRTDGSPASLGRIFWLRNFVNGALGIIPLYGLIEVLFIFGEAQQCLHDKIADTIVIKA
jgi:uncharacterized RDD family membrane protein YckC